MKNRVKQISANQIRKVIFQFVLCAVVLVTIFPQSISAQDFKTLTPAGAIIKYLGFVEDKLLFHVDIDNSKTERCIILIQDESGDVLYRQEFKDVKFIKTFGINKYELEGKNLVFILNKGKVKQEQVFEVSTTTRIVQDVIVAKQ